MRHAPFLPVRRRALALLAAGALVAPRSARAAGDPFLLGVASGDPLPEGVVLWTRLAPDPLAPGGGMGEEAVEVRWEVAEDDAFRRVVARGREVARAEHAHSVHAEVSGLRPGRFYFYRFDALGAASPAGRTRTAPAPEDARPVRLVSAGCQNYEHGFFTAWRHVAEEPDLDLVFHYGDYIYEYARLRPGWGTPVRAHEGGECLSLDDYRRRHAQYRLDPDLAAAHAAHPFVATYDDHEIENNWVGLVSQQDGSRRFPRLVTPEEFAPRLAAGLKAWWEHAPVRRSALPRGVEIAAYRRLQFGRALTLHALDTRRFRDDQPCGDGLREACEAASNPNAQVLGAAQEAWLAEGLRRSPARWQILAQQVFFAPRDLPGDRRAMDSWDGYRAARERVLAMLRGRDAAILTGDVHRAWAADVPGMGGAAAAVEFVASSITSEGDGSEAQPSAPEVMARNPHLRFHSNRRGYAVVTAHADRLEALFRALPYVSRPGAPAEDKGRFVTLAGRPGVVPA